MEHMAAAKTRVILGQTATSGDAGGFSKGQAQENVRGDILGADCAALARTIRGAILTPWTMFNHGAEAPVPRFKFQIEEAEDLEQTSRVIVNMSQAGFEADAAEVTEKFGMKFTRKAAPVPVPGSEFPPSPNELRRTSRVPGDAGDPSGPRPSTLDPSPDALAMRGERQARKYQRDLALKAQQSTDAVAAAALKSIVADDALYTQFLGPLNDALQECLAGMSEADLETDVPARQRFAERLQALLDSIPRLAKSMDTAALETAITNAMFSADANGRLQAAPADA